MAWEKLFNKLSKKKSPEASGTGNLKMPDIGAADPSRSSRILYELKELKNSESNSKGNRTYVDKLGGRYHVITMAQTEDSDIPKYPEMQQVVGEMMKSFANVATVVQIPGPKSDDVATQYAFYESPEDAHVAPEKHGWDSTDYDAAHADICLMDNLFGDRDRAFSSTKSFAEHGSHNIRLYGEGKYILFDYDGAQYFWTNGSALEGTFETIFRSDMNDRVLGVLIQKLSAMKTFYESDSGSELIQALVERSGMSISELFKKRTPYPGSGSEQYDLRYFHQEFVARISALLDQARKKREQPKESF